MIPEDLLYIIQKGEGIETEFKKSTFELPKNLFESVCAMLNRQGGHLLLGVTNEGVIEGVVEDCIPEMKSAFVSSANNTAQLNPKYYLNIQDIVINDKTILYTYIPESSQVHSFLGKVYDRNEDGDFDISNNPDLVRQLHLKKQGSFSENTIYPAITLSDLRTDLIQRCRTLANNNKPGHSWMELNNEEMLRSANLWKKDWKTGEEGYTLAAALVLGKDEVIQHILPHYKTDAIVRRDNIAHYDDREIVKTNLIESYDKLMAFVAKHLPDRFFLEGDQRISLREKIFREVVANTLIHREYTNEYPAKLVIGKFEVMLDNWNRPHGNGMLRLDSYSPFPKNPVIAAFFREIGRAEELGSGFRNSTLYTKMFTEGLEPVFEEGDIFRVTIPVQIKSDLVSEGKKPEVDGVKMQDDGVKVQDDGVKVQDDGVKLKIEGVIEGVNKARKHNLSILLKAIVQNEGKRTPDYKEITNLGSDRTLERYIEQLKTAGLIEFKGSATKTGGYFITDKFKKLINQ